MRPRLPALGAGLALLAGLLLAQVAGAQAPQPGSQPQPQPQPQSLPSTTEATPAPAARPRIGLVLSGGGARGLAHVGVLKVLEEMQVPIDVIAGTSMGAIVGGLYASGMRAAELERELRAVRWNEVFAARVERKLLSQRRKEEDFEISPLIELGLKNGALVAPTGAVSSRGLESLLRRYTLPVRGVTDFDRLPIAFRAVATDMETGAPVVLSQGDLALALRSSMSLPGLFAPTELGGRVLGDGGLVNNLPVDVARAMGADVVIVVNIGTPLGGRDSLVSAVGLTSQMINILTEQNVQRSLALLRPGDALISPVLGSLGAGDFDQAPALMALGEAGARGRSAPLAALGALDSGRASPSPTRAQPATPTLTAVQPLLAEVRIDASPLTNPARLLPMLDSRPGQRFDPQRAEADARRLAASGDYTRADYHLLPGPAAGAGEALVFELEDKPWGPNYLHAGLDLSTDFGGRSAFNLKLSHNRHWLTPQGTEWRNRVQIGEVPQLFTELYHPLAWAPSRADDWFVAGYAGLERRRQLRYGVAGDEVGEYLRSGLVTGLDIGQPWGDLGEFRFGWSRLVLRTTPQLVAATLAPSTAETRWAEDALRIRLVVDQLDFAVFPQSGYRGALEAWVGQRSGGLQGRFHRVEADGLLVRSFGAHTVQFSALVQTADQDLANGLERYRLGGFQQLSGYQTGQLAGNHALLLRMGWYRRLTQTPTLTRGFFVGGTLEAGNAWARRSDVSLTGLRTGISVFLGADTGIGPLYLGLTWAPELRRSALALFIGRP